ncbi:MAG: hypothetical protein GDA46_00110 [Bdellovibrionales bacterium]|nr:hypothetical protein [Bdellovibrionales bacterium]
MQNSPATIQKALYWFNKQDKSWLEHIEDSNTIVKMYLNSQKKSEEDSKFQTQVEKFSAREKIGATLISNDFSEKKIINSESLHTKTLENSNPFSNLTKFQSKNLSLKTTPPSQIFTLDEKSLQNLEETKKELNLQSTQEALRLLIQLGKKTLNRL